MMAENRRFTFGMFELRKFIVSDYLYLAGFCAVLIVHSLNALFQVSVEVRLAFSFLVSFALFFVVTGPFGLRYKNVYFSALWLSFCVLFMLNNFLLSWTPLVFFLFYQLLRTWFWIRNKREWIPWIVVKGGMIRHRSTFENAGGMHIDKKYTYVFFFSGLLIYLALLALTLTPYSPGWV